MDYKNKYIKYKTKYLKLLSEQNQNNNLNQLGGYNYSCCPNNKFNSICKINENGQYDSKDKCIKICENKYINKHLIKSRLKKETTQYSNLIKDLITENISVYIKGGTVLGLLILKDIYIYGINNNWSNNTWFKYFNEFIKLDLIRDWDFACYTDTGSRLTDEYKAKLDNIANKYKMVLRAKTFILYQTKYPIKLKDQALFELAILENEDNINLELPMTTIKVKVTLDNLNHIFMLANCFYKKTSFDIDFIKHAIKNIDFLIPKHKNGLYIMNEIYSGDLSPELVTFIKNFAKSDMNLQQFLITHFIEPHRMFYRLLIKNIPKSDKINLFYQKNKLNIKIPSLLIDSKYINNQIDLFIKSLSLYIYKIYLKNESNFEKIIFELDIFFSGVNFNRIHIEYNNINSIGKALIKTLFIKIYKNLLIKDTDSNLVKLLLFLNSKHVFD